MTISEPLTVRDGLRFLGNTARSWCLAMHYVGLQKVITAKALKMLVTNGLNDFETHKKCHLVRETTCNISCV